METPQSQIFRQAALDKLSSPEQLDQLMQVTTPKSWLALTGCCALVLTAVAWGLFGKIPTKVHGVGILIKHGGVFMVASRGEGNLLELRVQPHQFVRNGQILALVSQPELELRIRQGATNQQRLEGDLEVLLQFHTQERGKEETDQDTQRRTFAGMISNQTERIKALEDRVNVQQKLLARGLVAEERVLETRNSLYVATDERARAEVQLKQLDLNRLQAEERRRQQRLDLQKQIEQGAHQLQTLTNLYELNTRITSPYEGNVLEIMVKEGQLISGSTPILSLQPAAGDLEARLYLSPADGKLVATNMPVDLSPVSVKKEEYGLLRGHVVSVSPFPVTPQGMLRILENQALVNEFSQGGAPIEVSVALDRGKGTNQYAWSSAKGADVVLTSGTLCDGTITIKREHPIDLVLPIARKTAGF
jgi:HlyD family secretion protein